MTLAMEIGHSSYMIGKTRARLRYQRRHFEGIPVDADPKDKQISFELISSLEEKLVYLYCSHFSLTGHIV